MEKVLILGQSLSVSDSRAAYNRYRLLFQKKADLARSMFHDLYQQNNSLDDVVNQVPGQIARCLRPISEFCIKTLMEHGVLDIDEARFEEQYGAIQEIWGEPFLAVNDQYAEIVLDQKQLDEYRVARRQYRSRWQGGGFSLTGALQGAAMAGALNMVIGAGHMLFNGVGKVVSSISASRQKAKIFNSPETYDSIAQGVWNAAFAFHLALIDCLDQAGVDHVPLSGAISPGDAQSASAILNNAHLTKNLEQCRSAMIESFQLNPYQEEWYRFALMQFGDGDGTLSETAQYFGVMTIYEEKAAQIEAIAKALPIGTEEQALTSEQRIDAEKLRLHFSGETEHTAMILDAVQQFDLQYRTVDEITLPTRYEADTARAELVAIQQIEEQTDFESLSSIASSIERLHNYTSPVAERHRQELQAEYTDLDIRMRTLDTLLPDEKTILCQSVEQARQWMPIVQTLSERLASCGEGTASEATLFTLKRQLAAEALPAELVDHYTAEIDRRLTEIDLELRTALGKIYPTREAARNAEQVYEQIRADFVTGNPRKNGEKFRKRIENADFSEDTKAKLLDELFQAENAREIKTAKTFSTISTVILLAIVIASYFFHLSGTTEFARKNVIVKGVSLMVTDVQVVQDFSFVDGLKNGLVVFGRCVGDIFVNGFWDYIGGFQNGIIGNIVWGILGLIWVIIKHFLLFIPRYLVSLAVTLFQPVSFTYHIGYVIGSAIPLAVSQLTFDEDEQEENVKRIKGWTIRKILLTVFFILLVAAVTVYFIKNGL